MIPKETFNSHHSHKKEEFSFLKLRSYFFDESVKNLSRNSILKSLSLRAGERHTFETAKHQKYLQ